MRLLVDTPAENNLLDTNIVESLFYMLKNDMVEAPFTIGIHGEWGSGKTTIMRELEKRIRENHKDKFHTVFLNVWEYENTVSFIEMFAHNIYKELSGQLCDEEKKDQVGFTKDLYEKVLELLKSIVVDLCFKGPKLKEELMQTLSNNTIDSMINDNRTKEFHRREMIKQILDAEIFKKKKLIVFVDDLDRCDQAFVINIMESIKTVLSSKNCIFFIGCDEEYLTTALSIRYEPFIKRREELTTRNKYTQMQYSKSYLEKIFQLGIHIPSPRKNSTSKLLKNILLNINEEKGAPIIINECELGKIPELLTLLQKQKFLEEQFLNPRQIKLIINRIIYQIIGSTIKGGMTTQAGNLEQKIILLSVVEIFRFFTPYYKDSEITYFTEFFDFMEAEEYKELIGKYFPRLTYESVFEAKYHLFKKCFEELFEEPKIDSIYWTTNVTALIKDPLTREISNAFLNKLIRQEKYEVTTYYNHHVYTKGESVAKERFLFRFEVNEGIPKIVYNFRQYHSKLEGCKDIVFETVTDFKKEINALEKKLEKI